MTTPRSMTTDTMPEPPDEEEVTLGQACRALGVLRGRGYVLLADELIRGRKVNGQWMISMSSIRERLATMNQKFVTNRNSSPVPLPELPATKTGPAREVAA